MDLDDKNTSCKQRNNREYTGREKYLYKISDMVLQNFLCNKNVNVVNRCLPKPQLGLVACKVEHFPLLDNVLS